MMFHFFKQKQAKVLFISCLLSFTLSSTVPAQDWHASGNGGAVAGGGTMKSAEAGIEILEDKGGTAADAAVATLLVLTLEDRSLFCMGGEVPFIHCSGQTGEVKVLSGQGRAPLDSQAIDWLLANGIPDSDAPDNIKSAAVPAVIDLCVTAMQQWGKLSFEEVAEPAMRILAAGGVAWYDELKATMDKLIEAEQNTSGTYQEKLQAVSDRFYRGDIADDLDSWYQSEGGFLRKADLAAHVTNIEDPITETYRGYTINKCNTWTQGAFLLQTLKMLEAFDLEQMGHLSVDYIHVVAEAMKFCFADRDEYLADPEFEDIPLEELLDSGYVALRRELISMSRASDSIISGDPINKLARNPNPHPNLKWPHGTTTCCVVDRWGNMVACTPSGWGSNAGVGSTGVVHGTRLISLNNWDNHPNTIAPGKRPCITLTPTIVSKDGKPILAIAVAGGDEQEQATLNLFLNFLEFDMMPQDAVSKPRFVTSHYTSFFSQTPPLLARLWVSNQVPSSVLTGLSNRGHDIRTMTVRSNPVMIYIDHSDGMYYAAGCPLSYRKCKAYDLPVNSEGYNDVIKLQNVEIRTQLDKVEIHYFISNTESAKLSIYTVKGSLIQDLPLSKELGQHTITWNGKDAHSNSLPSGCYIVRFSQNNTSVCKRFMLTQ